MKVGKKELDGAVKALEDRIDDYYENVYQYEGVDGYSMYWKGYGAHLLLALRIIKSLRNNEFSYLGGGVYEFPFEDINLSGEDEVL